MLVLRSVITIGGKRFSAVNDVLINRSVYTLGGTAHVKIPVTALLKRKGVPPTRVQTAQEIKVGEVVVIKLGYDNRLHTEFKGYVKSINFATPVEIICEDEFWTTRNRNLTTSGTTSLKDLLNKCNLNVAFSEDLTLRNFAVPNKPISSVLNKIKTDYGLSIFFDMDGKVYACRPERVVGDEVKYELRRNVITDDNLQYKNRNDTKLQINAVCFTRDGNRVEAKKGTEGGAEKTLYFYDVTSESELAMLAQRELERYSYDGYDGSITTFLEPAAAPGMLANIVDPVYPERSGRYYIESVETTYGTGGGRRKIEIGSIV